MKMTNKKLVEMKGRMKKRMRKIKEKINSIANNAMEVSKSFLFLFLLGAESG